MKLSDLEHVLNIFKGKAISAEEQDTLFKEALLMILSRATVADTNIGKAEIATVQAIFKAHTEEDVSEKDIRVTAIAEQYETASFERFVSRAGSGLDKERRIELAIALAEVIRADDKVSPFEVEFFNTVVKELNLTAGDVAI